MRAVCALILAISLAVSASEGVNADALDDYYQANDGLEKLLNERVELEQRIAGAATAERVALERLAASESKLAALLVERTIHAAAQGEHERRLAAAEATIPALDEHAVRVQRRIEAQEEWLFGESQPRALSMRGYKVAVHTREQIAGEREAALAGILAVRSQEIYAVKDLGRVNTEVAFFERQGDALSRQVGTVRIQALGASARLGTVQRAGIEKAAVVQTQFQTLRSEGHPVGFTVAAAGLLPIPEPLTWPVTPPRGYVLPGAPSATTLRAGDPLKIIAPSQAGAIAPQAIPLQREWVPPVKGIITTPFGDATPYQSAHWAVDVGTRLYEPVRAASDGVVEFAGLAAAENRLASYGMVVLLRHDDRVTSVYAHLDDRAHGISVIAGDTVQKGQILGYVGLTGYSTGPHLHFEVRLDGQPLDPLLVVKI